VAPSRTIIVAGAGIGGLTAALALAAKDFRVIVLERAERLEETGAGLQLSPNASRVLVQLGLQSRLAPHAITPDAISMMSGRSGREIARLPLGEAAASRTGAPYWVMHRADLQSALQAEVNNTPGIELRLGTQFEDVAADAGGVTVGQRQGTTRQQDTALALIGADGVWSAVRQQLFPEAQPRFSRLIAWRGTIDRDRLPRGDMYRHVQLWMGPNAHLVAYPMSGGRQTNVVAIVPGAWNTPGWSSPGDVSEIRSRFAASRWPDSARIMIDAVDDWRKWALFTVSGTGAWSSGATALLGDAAHAMLPFAAQGAGMAIEDAAVLAKCLGEISGDGNAVAAALERYADLRRPRVTRVQRAASQAGRIYHLGGAAAVARDLVIKAMGGQRVLARQDWIYDWRV
jgi:salicylate hydroxylase